MAGRLEGKVALISGAARGQGRSHALRLAQEGADIIAFDVCRQLDTVPYPMATPEDLAYTVKLVEERDGRIVVREADVRDSATVQALVHEGVREFGRLDVVCANAGIAGVVENTWTMTEEAWEETIAVDLTGVWKTVKAAVPAMIQAGNGGSIAITSSTFGVKDMIGIAHYVAAKHAVVGLMRTLANELAPHFIRVNTVHPTGVDTPFMAHGVLQHRQPGQPAERPAGGDGRAGGHLQRHRVARLRGGPLRHGRVAAGGRRVPAAVTTPAAPAVPSAFGPR